MIDQEIKKTLSQIQLLSFLNEETLQSLTENAKSVTYTRGQKIVTKGKSIDNFYIIQSGELKSIDEINGDEIILANFHKGEFFGERALIKNEPAYATIKAVTDVELIEISKELFLEIIESNNAIKKYVKDFLFNRAIHNFLRKFSLFGEMEAEEVTNWFKLLHYETAFNDKEIVFNEGDEADKFYILVKGNVDVIMHNKTISTLHEGEFFGELAIINNQPRAATIQANGKVLLVSLSKEHFEKLIKKSPELNQKIRTVIDMYRTNTDDIDEVASSLEPEFDPLSIKNQLESVEIKPNLKTFFGKKKYPFEKQFNQTDSISACISMVSKYYNKEISLTRIRDLASIEEHVKSLMSVSYAAEHLGFNTKVIDVEMNDFSNMQTPFIAKISKGQFVVVYEVHAQHLLIANPASGISKISVKDFESFYEKSILSMEPTSAFIGQKNSSSSMTRFLVLLSPYKKLMTEIFIVSLLVSIFGLGAPIFTRLVIDNIVVHHNESLLNTMMVGMLMVGVFLGISVALRTYLVTYLGNKVQMQMLGQFYKHILSLPMSFFAKKKVGDIMSRFNESARVQQMLTGASLGMFIDVIMVVVYVAVMFSFNSTLAFMILGFILAVAIVTISFTGMMKSISKQGFSKNAQADALLVESLSGVMTIKATSSELQSRWKWEDLFIESLQLRSKTSMINAISQSLGQSLKLFAVVILLWYGTILVMEGEMTVGQVMAFNMLVMMSMGPIQKVLGMWNEIQETMMSVGRLNDIYDLEPEEKLDSENLEHLPPIKGHVKFEKVSFAYTRAGGYILKNVSFEVPQGQKVAIVGRSGGGKSTLINLLLRFNDVSDGKITIDGFNIAHTSIYSLRKQIGTVLQESHLFNGTIKENIALAKPDASFSEIIKAAELAAAHDFISSLPMGYNTVIGERGAGLSGGQRQRISIARTLLTNPKILVMDEATSALDNESERAIQNNLGEITKGRTTFIIAHRLSTVRDADVILVMDKGYVAEMGSHDELIQKRGLYFYLNNTSLSLS